MTNLSIVIVNYNVKYFLRQCLQSIFNSECDYKLEVIVVDNNSVDDSLDMIKAEFPSVHIIANNKNLGFSKANNLGFNKAQGEYILVLNPDTILAQDTLQKSLDFIKDYPDAGAVGVKMFDGGGNYLPESKRGFPSPSASLYKLTGLYKLFKRSSRFNAYYEGHKNADQNHETEVLTGAFMLMPKSVVDLVQGFDEDYFMYGEDIELSYQIKEKGYKIYYFSETSIIHFKGESTTKSSIAYLKNFYGAMAIFAQKRNSSATFLWKAILNIGIFFTAGVGSVRMLFRSLFRLIFDFGISILSFYLILNLWARFYFNDPDYYAEADTGLASLIIIAVLVITFYFFGHYDKRYAYRQWGFAGMIGFLTGLSVYALYPLEWRFSRFVLFIFLICFPLVVLLTRIIANKFVAGTWSIHSNKNKRTLILGSESSYNILKSNHGGKSNTNIITYIDTVSNEVSLEYLQQLIRSRQINEVICCMHEVDLNKVFLWMNSFSNLVQFKLANKDNSIVLGSSSKNNLGEWYTMELEYRLDQKFYKRLKRLVDFSTALFLGILCPILFPFIKYTTIKNIIPVLFSMKTWIGYNHVDSQLNSLPFIKSSVYNLVLNSNVELSSEQIHRDNIYYAQHFNIWIELEQIIKSIFK